MEKMLMIIYNEAIDAEIMELIDEKKYSFTKIRGVFGRGKTSGAHLGDDVWPGRNNILFLGCRIDELKELISKIKILKQKLAKEGLKAFIFKIEDFV